MSVQKRPLTGMVTPATGLAAPIPVLAATATIAHTLGAVPSTQGGPFIDQITLIVNNKDANTARTLTIVICGVTITQSIPALTTVTIFADIPFASARDAAAATLTVQASLIDTLTVWGWFARPL